MQRLGVLLERCSCQEAAVAASRSVAGASQERCGNVAGAQKQQPAQQQWQERLQEYERYVAGALLRLESLQSFSKVVAEA